MLYIGDSKAAEELRNYYREIDATIADARGITDQTQSGEGYSRTEFLESERVHANTEKADTDTGRRETDDLIRQAEITRRSSEINRRNSASDNPCKKIENDIYNFPTWQYCKYKDIFDSHIIINSTAKFYISISY